MSQNQTVDTHSAASKKTAGAFDIRNVIGLLLGIYGVVLLLAWKFLDPGVNPDTQQLKESAYNGWVGLGILVVAVVFFLWAKLAPIVVSTEPEAPAGGVAEQ